MGLVSDPAIAVKIAKMKQRVRWQHPLMERHHVDQTCFTLAAGTDNGSGSEATNFSFLVIGDSGTNRYLKDPPQRRIARRLLEHTDTCDFVLHTGDVVYLVGSSEQYPDNFIKPYREFLVGGSKPHKIRFDKMTFKLPFLPVLGNHDYYDLPVTAGILSQAFYPIRRLLRRRINLDVGWHGSFQGEGFAKAFLDFTQSFNQDQLTRHIKTHYTGTPTSSPLSTSSTTPARSNEQRCLHYQPGQFTRLPNRYYTFRRGGIDFFALDSNTFNSPQPLPQTAAGQAQRQKLEQRLKVLLAKEQVLLAKSEALNVDIPEQDQRATSLYATIEQIDEQLRDIEKQLNQPFSSGELDTEQLLWLRNRLIASWQDPTAKGRILYFHHPPYVTESTKWDQGQTLAVRDRLREVLDQVEAAIGTETGGRSLVDLVLTGHAHCFEYLRTLETGHGDRNIPWIVCGGSGFSLRRQREEGSILEEDGQAVAKSHLFVGRAKKRRPYSALKVDVSYEPRQSSPTFTLRPLIAEKADGKWRNYDLDPIIVVNSPKS